MEFMTLDNGVAHVNTGVCGTEGSYVSIWQHVVSLLAQPQQYTKHLGNPCQTPGTLRVVCRSTTYPAASKTSRCPPGAGAPTM